MLGTWRIVPGIRERTRTPENSSGLIRLLKTRHAAIMKGRPDMRPGEFKSTGNRAGSTFFVSPGPVLGTLEQGSALYRSLETPFQRAVLITFLVSEIRPFADGNGRTTRVMMNAELEAAGEERIVIPTVYRANDPAALKALSLSGRPTPLMRMLDYAQRRATAIDWRSAEKPDTH